MVRGYLVELVVAARSDNARVERATAVGGNEGEEEEERKRRR